MVAGKQLNAFVVAAEERQHKINTFNEQRARIQAQIDAIDSYEHQNFDYGMDEIEDRNEKNALESELRYIDKELEKLYNQR